jgi:tetratricopeptide (TPR) repeat protein/tRNA A-37 threonylcarbamoyl transferase component Bud32
MYNREVVNRAEWTTIQEVFHGAIKLAPAERLAYVRSQKLGPLLEEEVLSLLESGTGPLDRLPPEIPFEDQASLRPGDVVGSYRLIAPLHEGGMGVVFLAERADQQYQQRVAIKFIRGELALFGLERRFRVERQILANLNHPNIAKLIDGGVTPAGQAYLVMDYVEGRPLIEAAAGAPLGQKLRLFMKVCDAVQYAHQNLVVHRDLKPANILLNDQGEPKLLDFGIAKILDPSESQTATIAQAFTPRYASPEQVLGNPVSTLSDVYSLGVLLYELLAGVLPYNAQALDSTRLLRAIVEEESVRPSSHARGLPADLDFIVLKALRKEPGQRYGSVSDLAGDIQNVLDGRPVTARAPTLQYLARKFVRRHRGSVIAASVAACAIAIGVGMTLRQSHVANQERDKAQAVSAFMQELIQSGGPDRAKFRARGLDLRVVDVLDDSATLVDLDFANQPDTLIEMHHTLAHSYLGLGAWDKAKIQADLALAQARRYLGERNLTTATMYLTEGEVLFKQENHQAAIASYRRALDIYQALAPRDPLRFAIQKDLASSELNFGLRDDALRDIQAAVAGFRSLPAHGSDLGLALCDLATVYRQRGAEQLEDQAGKESIDTLRRLADPPVNLGTCLNNRALFLQDAGRLEEALAAAKEAVTFTRSRVGSDYIELAGLLSVQGDLLRVLHRNAEARAAMDEALAVALKNYPRDQEWPQYILYMYGKMQCDPGFHEYQEGALKLGEALQKRRPNLPADDMQISAMTFSLGRCLVALNRPAESEPMFREALRIRVKRLGADSPSTKRALDLYRQVLDARGLKLSPEQAIALASK